MGKMNVSVTVVSVLLLLVGHGWEATAVRRRRSLSEEWGYVEVKLKAHMFRWLSRNPNRVDGHPSKPWPTNYGCGGASGVGTGNFEENGPLDTKLKPRNSTWLQIADRLFMDNPVGTGYGYVEDTTLFMKTGEEAATDLTTLLKALFNKNEELQKSPLYIVAESYGGRFTVTAASSALKAIEAGKLKLEPGGSNTLHILKTHFSDLSSQ